MIYVTHDQEEALTLSDQIAVFHNGGVEQVGTPREIYYHPASEFVTTFIGDTNRMTESLITQLNEQNKGAGLNPSDHIYVRVENVKESVHAGEENRYYKLQARFETEEFYGITTRRTFLAGDTEIKSVNTKNDEKLEKGTEAVLYIDPADLIIFREG